MPPDPPGPDPHSPAPQRLDPPGPDPHRPDPHSPDPHPTRSAPGGAHGPDPDGSGPDWSGPDWQGAGWRAQVHGWVADRLVDCGRRLTGPLETVRARPWSVVLRAASTAGPVWFKANSVGARYEATLVDTLARWVPDAVLTALAVDRQRGWLLTADAGPTLLDVLGERPDPDRWARMLTGYARLQRTLEPRADELAALGVPDLRPDRMPAVLDHLLDDAAVRAGLGAHRLAAVRELRPAYRDWCAELAGDGIAASLQHDDLSDSNVFAVGTGHRFFDWGDASVAHPFASLLVALSVATHRLGLTAGGPELTRLRDAYLQPWDDGYDRSRLLRSTVLATRVARVGRALAWQRVLTGPGMEPGPEHRSAVWEWLAELPAPDVC